MADTTYPCPYCAEQIQREASNCRFCHRKVLLDVIVSKKPPSANLGELTKELFAKLGMRDFETYGQMRQALEQPEPIIARSVRRAEADGVEEILKRYDAAARAVLVESVTAAVISASASASRARQAALLAGVAALLVIGAYVWQQRQSSPPSIVIAPAVEGPSKPEKLPARYPSSPKAQRDPQRTPPAHVKKLVDATATLRGSGGLGSAFFIHRDGYLITNNHVTERMASITVQTSDGRTRPGQILRRDKLHDLVLLKVDGGPYPTLKMGNATNLDQGEIVWTIGAPHGLSFSVTKGIVSYVGRRINGKAFIQADVAINPGNSGGPMINESGEVIGINNFIISNAEGLNFAIPINYIYMGSDPIAADILTTRSDNKRMARWRSWENDPDSSTVSFKRAPQVQEQPETTEAYRQAMREIQAHHRRFLVEQRRNQQELREMRSERSELRKKYMGDTGSISADQEIGQRISSLTQRILEMEIDFLSRTIEHFQRSERLLRQAQGLVSTSPKLQAQIDTRLEQARQTREGASSLLTRRKQELANEQMRVY